MNINFHVESPMGLIEIGTDETHLVRLDFVENVKKQIPPRSLFSHNIHKELMEYFEKKRTSFTIPIRLEGTPFQLSVWKALTTIRYGKVKSYADIATQIGNPNAVRAVGMTNGKNPIAIIVPCHRVIGKNGKMIGYSSGIWRKEWLLAHEKNFSS